MPKKKIVRINQLLPSLLAWSILFSLSSCKKVSDLKPTPPMDSTLANAMYPVRKSYSEGAYSRTYQYEYNQENHLVKYAMGDVATWEISPSQLDVTTYDYNSSDHSVYSIYVTSYVFSLAGVPTNTLINLYNTAPTRVDWRGTYKVMATGVVRDLPGGVSIFSNNKEGLPFHIINNTSDNQSFSYDAKGNLVKIEVAPLSGPRNSLVSTRITFSDFDTKPSPFSAVKGYWPASFPQGYTWDYALAFCKNNPKRTTTELYDASKSAFVIQQIDEYTYVYNEKGYPTQITISTTDYGAVNTHSSRIYSYTYK